jgi:hypothetical protein
MIYELETSVSTLKGKKFSSPNFSFRVGEEFEHNGHKYLIMYITHIFGASGHYTKTKVGLDR